MNVQSVHHSLKHTLSDGDAIAVLHMVCRYAICAFAAVEFPVLYDLHVSIGRWQISCEIAKFSLKEWYLRLWQARCPTAGCWRPADT